MSAIPPKADIGTQVLRCPLCARSGHSAVRRNTSLSADKHDLASRSWLKNLLVRARRLGQRQFLANNGPQTAIFEACKEPGVDVRLFGRRNDPERERPNRSATRH